MEKEIPQSFLRARRMLLLDHPFFGSLAMHLKPVVDPKCKTTWTDGEKIGFNPEHFDKLPVSEAAGVLAHQILSCALEHQFRRGNRDVGEWNKASDLVINPIIRKSGLPLPADCPVDMQYEGKAVEEVYRTLNTQKPQPGSGSGAENGPAGQGQKPGGEPGGQDTPGNNPNKAPQQPVPSTGEVRDAQGNEEGQASPAEAQKQQDDWKINVQQAVLNAQGQGFLPAELLRVATEILTPKVSWRDELRRFFQTIGGTDLSWAKVNRRFAMNGIQMPAVRGERMGAMVVAIDTSGSIGGRVLSLFEAEINAIAEDVNPENVFVVYCDARVTRVDEFGIDSYPIKLQAIGGGGTKFEPVFQWVEQQGLVPECLVYLTDMFGSFPTAAPDYPVLWAQVGRGRPAPFGEVVTVDTSREV